MIAWLNENQGFVMSMLTLVYVVATVLIQNANRNSANAATIANKQQLALQLLDRRLNSYYKLNDWILIAKSISNQSLTKGNFDAFSSLLYSNAKDKELDSINGQLRSLDYRLSQNNIPNEEQIQLVATRERLIEERFLKRFAMLDAERGLINQIEVLFPQIGFEPIKKFCDSFIRTAIDSTLDYSAENIEQLKSNVQVIIDKDILGSLWKMIKDI